LLPLRAGLVLGAAVGGLSVSTGALGQDTSVTARRAVAAREQGIPYTVVEVGAGVIALPAAEVCPTSLDQCQTGEVSLGLGIRNVYQFGPFGVGAGVVWGTSLLEEDARGAAYLEREHTRRYFQVEGLFRYSFVETPDAEGWVGGTVGLVMVLDEWSVRADRDPPNTVRFVGPESLVIGTEGFTTTVGAGGSWIFAENFSLGGVFRYGNWILPFEPETSPVGDVASLSGRVDVFDLTVSLAYRLAL
jgi:hypothetical protein